MPSRYASELHHHGLSRCDQSLQAKSIKIDILQFSRHFAMQVQESTSFRINQDIASFLDHFPACLSISIIRQSSRVVLWRKTRQCTAVSVPCRQQYHNLHLDLCMDLLTRSLWINAEDAVRRCPIRHIWQRSSIIV